MTRVAALQMEAAAGDLPANLAMLEDALAQAAAGGAALLVAPELATTGYGAGEAIRALAEPLDGPTANRLAAAVEATGAALATGFALRDEGGVRNAALLLRPGDGRTAYRKRQLYGDYERALFAPGDADAPLVEIDGMRMGLLICFDAEFPEHVRALARKGAQAVLVPTALPAGSGCDFVATRVLPTRAFENQIFVAYADHAGHDGRFAYAGLSCVCAPDGADLARAGREAALLFADLDDAAYAASREANPYLGELRP
jgi:predicted amidohydrolase